VLALRNQLAAWDFDDGFDVAIETNVSGDVNACDVGLEGFGIPNGDSVD
jgi:hypothetical protein